MPAQGNSLDDLVRLDVDDVEGALGFVADVDAAAVGRGAGAVADFDSVDHGDDLVRRGIDDVDVVAGAIGLDNPDLVLRRGRRRAQGHSDDH